MPNPVGTRLRFFSRRVFGVWVDGRITRYDPRHRIVTIAAHYHGHSWTERWSADTEFYYPSDHPQRGEAFNLAPT